ncbi:SFRP2 protein, partial [Amia calva]|nr:SFRP2 protein [Amia calva]
GVFASDRASSPGLSSTRSACKPIPDTLGLCRGVGYPQMRLPNLLGHHTVREAQQQAGPWVPLLAKQCHPDTKMFLCSLFAPVCLLELPGPVRPCRSLCEGVRAGCLPVMSAFGFPWPDMFNCSQFPAGSEVCIPPTGPRAKDSGAPHHNDTGTVMCDACSDSEPELQRRYCHSDFAVRLRVKETSSEGADRRIVAHGRSRVLLRRGDRAEEEAMARSDLWLEEGSKCACEELDHYSSGTILALGNKVEGRLMVSRMLLWKRADKELRKFIRSLQKLVC